MAKTEKILEAHAGLTLGASEIAAAAGLDPWRTTLQLYLDKRHGRLQVDPNDAMQWGLWNEYHILQMHARMNGMPVLGMDLDEEPCLFLPNSRPLWSGQSGFKRQVSHDVVKLITETCVHPTYSFLTCHPDGFMLMSNGWIDEVVQAKNMSAYADLGDDLPPQYQLQAQHELMVIAAMADAPSLIHSTSIFKGGSQFREFESRASDAVQEYIVAIARDFVRRVEEGDPPAAEPTQKGAKDLARLFPGVGPGLLIKEETPLMEAADALSGLKDQIDSLKDEKTAIEVKIRELMGEHTSANDIDKTIKLSLSKQQVRKTVNWKAVSEALWEELESWTDQVDGSWLDELKLKHTKLGEPFRTLRSTFK